MLRTYKQICPGLRRQAINYHNLSENLEVGSGLGTSVSHCRDDDSFHSYIYLHSHVNLPLPYGINF